VRKSLLTAYQITIDGWEKAFDPEAMADYDANFPENGEPVFLNIWTKKPGEGFGYLFSAEFLWCSI
jgi:hypothetical protein